MKKRIILAIMTMAMVISLVACSDKKEVISEPENSKEGTAGIGKIHRVNLEVKMLSEDEYETMKADGAQTVESGETEYVAHILVTMDQDVKDFTLWSINADFENEGETVKITEDKKLDFVSDVKANEPVIVTTSLGEILPIVGFSFLDNDGFTRHFTLGESGEDGSAFYEEFRVR